MAEILNENSELTSLAAELSELQEKRREFRRDPEKKQENEHRIDRLKTRFIYLLTNSLIDNPHIAREIVEEADNMFTDKPRYGEHEFRSVVFRLLLKKRIKEGLYVPQNNEKSVHMDYSNALNFIERRMAMIEKMVAKGFKDYEPYLQYLRDARCKLKVWETTCWVGTEYEDQFIQMYGGNHNKDTFWNDLLVYIAQKSPGEIGGVDQVDGENRLVDHSPDNPEKTFINLRPGNQIVDEVIAEAFKYDIYTASFLAVLERDLEIGTGQVLHYQRMGRWSRRRYTDAMCREAQRMYRPTIERHNLEVAEKVREIIDTDGKELIPAADEKFAERLEAIMQMFPQYKYEDVEPKLPEEAWVNYKVEYEETADPDECIFVNADETSDLTAFEDSRTNWDNT